MRYFHYLLLYTFWGLGLAACSSSQSSSLEEGEAAEAEEVKFNTQQEQTAVQLYVAARKPFEYQIQVNGKVEAGQQAELRFRNGGYLKKIHVSNGQQVAAGQILAELDKTEWQLALQSAQNELLLAREEYIKEVIDYGGNPMAADVGIDPQLHERIRVRKGVKGAEIRVAQAQFQLDAATLRSPFGGVVSDLLVREGNFISPAQSFCQIYAHRQPELVVEVLESEVALLRKGQVAQVRLLSYPDKQYTARLMEINPKINQNGMLRLKFRFDQSEGVLLGMNASARVVVPQREGIVVPKEAIVIRSGKKVVFTEEKGLAKWNYVQVGLENNQEVEILEGLKEQQRVIVSNNLQLAHDSPVKVAE
jgi:RND family efflux transporter MFP subunit